MKPNILIVNVDQQRYDSLGFNGNTIVKTPNLDKLGAEGVIFDKAYTPLPVCCPARQTFLCGVTPEVHGQLWNFGGMGHRIDGLNPDEHTIWVNLLRESGYRTAYVGKWHVNPVVDPTGFGYEFYDSGSKWKEVRQGKLKKDNAKALDKIMSICGIGVYDEGDVLESKTHMMAKEAISYIDKFERESEDSPWHVRLDYSPPHLPCHPAEPFASMYPPEEIPAWGSFGDELGNKPYIQKQQLYNWGIENWTWENEWSKYVSQYFGMVSQVDDAIGLVLTYLEESGNLENTIIIYTTDHGDACGGHGMMDKHYIMYEDVVHVPLIIRYDGFAKKSFRCDNLINHYLDIPVTLLDMLGIEKPEAYQGESFLTQLKGEENPNKRSVVTSSYNGQQFGLYTQRMIFDGRYKYIWNLTDIDEFYDLQRDKDELNNLIVEKSYALKIDEMRKSLFEELTKLKDPIVRFPWMEHQLRDGNKLPFVSTQ